jgi:GDP/UDP-N,N'-diacetylbacillosamine 2-epimerase (hydrolysing)
MLKKILFFTGTRADYGLLSPLIKRFVQSELFNVKILASGTHIDQMFGDSHKEIESDGLRIDFKVDIQLSGDSPLSVANSTGLAVAKCAQVLNDFEPDLSYVLGDRFEALGFAIAAQILNRPLAHIHGGEITEGAMDDAFRHSITKLSLLHFTSAEIHANRVIQMGEAPERVFNVGALGVENSMTQTKLSLEELSVKFGIKFKKRNFLVTFHPETIGPQDSDAQIDHLIESLKRLKKELNNDCTIIFTMPNADPGYQPIRNKIEKLVAENRENIYAFETLGMKNYISLLSYMTAVIGNSSSALIEAPALKIPTIDIGNRQKGRLTAPSVFNCSCTSEEIFSTITKVLMTNGKINFTSPYCQALVSTKIFEISLKFLKSELPIKKFYDQN